jgi:hypothetical protein
MGGESSTHRLLKSMMKSILKGFIRKGEEKGKEPICQLSQMP